MNTIEIKRIRVWWAAVVYATCIVTGMIIFSPLIALLALSRPHDGGEMLGTFMVTIFMYPIMIFIFTLISAGVYNLVVRLIGTGFLVEIEAPNAAVGQYVDPARIEELSR